MESLYTQNSKCFAVIDTETNWDDIVMSIGLVIADSSNFEPIEMKYYIITPECDRGGMYSYAMMIKKQKVNLKGSRLDVIADIECVLRTYNVSSIFAYNASFDFNHLPELKEYRWFDIIKIAAYKQYNSALPDYEDYCATGRLKRNYGVEPIMEYLTGSYYCEKHNALCDAIDELKIMGLLEYSIDKYDFTQINGVKKVRIKQLPEYKKNKKEAAKRTSRPKKVKEFICEYKIGDIVTHIEYGKGIIQDIRIINYELYFIIVDFKLFGEMVFKMPHNKKLFHINDSIEEQK